MLFSDDHTGQPVPDPIFERSAADEVTDELNFHVDMRTRELIAQGIAPDLARRMARERFTDFDRVTEECHHLAQQREHAVKRSRYFTNILQDIQFALRMLRRRRAFAALAIVPMALGIGAATAIYSVVDGVMLRPLPFAESGRLVAVWLTDSGWKKTPTLASRWDRIVLGQTEYAALRDRATHLRGLALWATGSSLLVDSRGSEPVMTARVTSNMLALLGVRPAFGRGFLPGEDAFDGPRIAMLSWERWHDHFSGDSGVVGRSIMLENRRYTVVGVLPRGLRLERTGAGPAVWIPAMQDSNDLAENHNRSYHALARLVPGATVAQATDEVTRIARDNQFWSSWSAAGKIGGRVAVWQVDQTRDVRASLWILSGAVTLLLLIACVNVATLMLGEAARREPEIGARSALGASAGRLARQLLTESVAIAVIGTAIGTALAWAGTRALVAVAPPRIPGLDDVHLDWRVLGFAAACAIITGVAFGLVPALTLAKLGRHSTVRIGAGQTARGTRSLQRGLIAADVALSLVLLVGCALLGRSLARLSTIDPGFRPQGVLIVQVRSQRAFWQNGARIRAFYGAALREIAAIPGVTAVSGSSAAPFSGGGSSSPIKVEGKTYASNDNGPQIQQRTVLPNYFGVLGIPVLTGRTFTEADRDGTDPVAIISESAARRDWPDQSPVGHRVYWQRHWLTVVGIAGDIRYAQLSRDVEPTIYLPFDQRPGSGIDFVIRGGGNVANLAATVRHRLAPLDPDVAVASIDPLPTLIVRSYGEERFRALLGSLFGILASVLAAVGMFGVISRTVARRMREVGIRAALGASAPSLARLMMRETVIGAGVGVLIGVPASLAVGRLLSPFLFGVDPHDPVAFGLALLLLASATLIATLPAARRAGRVDPVTVLRAE